jgi:hypothetical protein
MRACGHLAPIVAGMVLGTLPLGCSDVRSSGESLLSSSHYSPAGPTPHRLLENVAFRGRDGGPFDLVEGGVCGSGLFEVRSHTSGTATLVGAYEWTTVECFNGSTGHFTGTFTLTSASRSTLIGMYSGDITGLVDEVTATYDFTAMITGGTGRFAGASGSFSGAGQANLATLQQTQSFSGSLSLPNPGQS